ncbi:hypothetical protein [Mesorhizobium argentiipisi]|uniref:Uncharacterized protein n=1 Tax=Mesorhizobium argentiipisi TaxID=3015175 RepID=A0ABU8KCX0_9HYPH
MIPSGPGNLKHLFVVVTQRCGDGQHLLISICSIRPNIKHDATCEFDGGEHEFITGPSYVYYRKPDMRLSTGISRMVDKGYFIAKQDFGTRHFVRLCAGVAASPFTTPSTLKYFQANRVA